MGTADRMWLLFLCGVCGMAWSGECQDARWRTWQARVWCLASGYLDGNFLIVLAAEAFVDRRLGSSPQLLLHLVPLRDVIHCNIRKRLRTALKVEVLCARWATGERMSASRGGCGRAPTSKLTAPAFTPIANSEDMPPRHAV